MVEIELGAGQEDLGGEHLYLVAKAQYDPDARQRFLMYYMQKSKGKE